MCDPEKTKHFLTCLPKSFHCKNLVWPGPPPGRSCVSPLFFNLLSSLVLCYLFPIELDGVNLVSSLWKPRGQKLHWNNPSVTGWVPFFPLTFLCLDFDNMPSAIGGRMGTLLLDGFCDCFFYPFPMMHTMMHNPGNFSLRPIPCYSVTTEWHWTAFAILAMFGQMLTQQQHKYTRVRSPTDPQPMQRRTVNKSSSLSSGGSVV